MPSSWTIRVAAGLIDTLIGVGLALVAGIALTGGWTGAIGGLFINATDTGNIVVAVALLTTARCFWLGHLPAIGTGATPRALVDGAAARVVSAAQQSTADERWVRPALVIVVGTTTLLRLANAWFHPGFVTGDDVELHELTFGVLFDKSWPIWELRSPLYPMTFLYPAQALALALGLDDTAQLVFAGRLVVAALTTASPILVYVITVRLTGSAGAALLGATLFATSRMHVWFGASEFPRPVATVFVLAAFALLLKSSSTRAMLAGVCIGVAGALRFSEFVFIVPALTQLAAARRVGHALIAGASALVTGALLLSVADWRYWGSPFYSLTHVVEYTLVRGESTRGFQPPWYYLANAANWSTLVVVGLSLYSLIGRERRPALWGWLALGLLSVLPHKEARYAIPAHPFVCISAVIGLKMLAERAGHLRRAPLRLPAVTAIALLLSVLFEASSWRVRRSDGEVQVARDLLEEFRPASIAAVEMWRFGSRLYWRDVPTVIPIAPGPLATVPAAELILLSEDASDADVALLARAGFTEAGRQGRYRIFLTLASGIDSHLKSQRSPQPTRMPWKCPACQSPIHHSEVEAAPRPGHEYRCHVCRLELVVDPRTGRLIMAPLTDDEQPRRPTR